MNIVVFFTSPNPFKDRVYYHWDEHRWIQHGDKVKKEKKNIKKYIWDVDLLCPKKKYFVSQKNLNVSQMLKNVSQKN